MLKVLLVFLLLVCHGSVMIAAYNRINATGLSRRFVKTVSKLMAVWTVVAPILFYWTASHSWTNGIAADLSRGTLPVWQGIYLVAVVSCAAFMAIPWLLSRPILRLGWADHDEKSLRRYRVASEVGAKLCRTRKCRRMAKVPGNDMLNLDIRQIDLAVPNLPPELKGYRIAHLSDFHLTGHIGPEFHRFAMDQAAAWEPELIAVSGDLLDAAECLKWLPDIFGAATAPDGCHFILGNHDGRIGDVDPIRRRMSELGWNDVGGKMDAHRFRSHLGHIIGNEHPWYRRPTVASGTNDDPSGFRLMISHSPDGWDFARDHGVHLTLAGHTHGGQGRLPVIGPVLSPSRHGSRHASGFFERNGHVLAVTRGVSGKHLLRIRCAPEALLLRLVDAISS